MTLHGASSPPHLDSPRPGVARLSVRNVSKAFPGEFGEVVGRLSLDVRAGEFHALIGPSGCGKSTLLNLVAGLLEPDDGEILIGGATGRRLGRVAYMHQRDLLLPWRTVLENARLGLELKGMPREESDERVRATARLFGLDGALGMRPWQLSGGMRQRAALLRATLPDSGVLLLDEPFGALDAITRADLQDWLSSVLDTSDRAVLLVTHDVDEALLLADRVHVMTGHPGTIRTTLEVPMERPRRREALLERDFIELKSRLLSALSERGE